MDTGGRASDLKILHYSGVKKKTHLALLKTNQKKKKNVRHFQLAILFVCGAIEFEGCLNTQPVDASNS